MSKTESPNYWKSLNQIAQNDTYKNFADREFQEGASELTDGLSRKSFLQIMGASIALAGLASCRRPVEKILPYHQQPEQSVIGNPLYYATAMPMGGYLTGIIAESKEGRPTKLEGNPDQDASKGKSNIFHQAAILGLYDPDRARKVRLNGEDSTWDAFVAFCTSQFADKSRNVAVLSEGNSSQTMARLRRDSGFSNLRWVTYEPFGDENQLAGNALAFGRRLRSDVHFDQAQVIVSIDSDFLNLSTNNVENVRRYTDRRAKVESNAGEISRMYSIESTYTVTGSNADHRLRLKPSDIQAFAYALASELGVAAGYNNHMSGNAYLTSVVADLRAHAGNSVVVAGDGMPAEIHAAVAAINGALGNNGTTVTYKEVSHTGDGDQREALAQLVADLNSGTIDTLVLLGTNPVFNAPADLDMANAIKKAATTIQVSDYVDETTRNGVTWHIPRTHFLEAWGDGASPSGQASIIQPLIQPLFGAKSEIEVMNAVFSGTDTPGYDLVRATWVSNLGESGWTTALNDGVIPNTAKADVSVSVTAGLAGALATAMQAVASASSDLEVSFKPDNHVFDGRFANNGWLQEFPDPITKITWDNVVLVSPDTANSLGIKDIYNGINNENHTTLISVTVNGNSVTVPAWILPGHADNVITVLCGNGSNVGKVSTGVGTNTYPLRQSSAMYAAKASISADQGTYMIACTQDHHSMEGRPLYRQATVAEYQDDPTFAQKMVYVPGKKDDDPFAITLFDAQTYPEYEPQWGMTIDLNSCIGCGVCTIACQAENNIPVIGKKEVSRSREMQWIRVDRYFVGDDVSNPQMVHQPIPCMHCELAPCEQVCPVAATTHSDDGLNQMTYNRCIGTRYCSNNCPYKVRRFNFFNYTKVYLEENNADDPEILHMAMNPDVTIRFRGVMEKCTYCVQRINRKKIETKIETGNSVKPADGSVVTACQQACPANAISFGDLTDANSKVSKAKASTRNYLLLEELNIRPRTSYLARITNPNGQTVNA
jgi:molybdopterin-containing oxidoreductase family iron-sulfur binding subunit